MASKNSKSPDKGCFDHFTPEEVQMIRDTVAKGISEEELKLFLYTAKARGLDPLLKQIYFIRRKQRRGDRWVDIGTIQTGIDGFRLIANRTGKLKGIERGVNRDEKGKISAWARVWRTDWSQPAYEEVTLDEYKGDTPLWQRMPEQMLKKCAEVAALRMAFPEDLSGLYSHEEMDQADKSEDRPRHGKEEKPPLPQEFMEPAEQKIGKTRKAMKDCLNTITRLQNEFHLSREEIQWATGLETLKGASYEILEKATNDVMEYCERKKAPLH